MSVRAIHILDEFKAICGIAATVVAMQYGLAVGISLGAITIVSMFVWAADRQRMEQP